MPTKNGVSLWLLIEQMMSINGNVNMQAEASAFWDVEEKLVRFETTW